MPELPKTYEEWLDLSADEKHEVHFKGWNVYRREGIGFAYTEAGRLAIQSPYQIYCEFNLVETI